MQKKILSEADDYFAKKRHHRRWVKVVSILACLVVFCTTYALILPAITLEKTPNCGKTEHTHDESCYAQETSNVEMVPICSAEKLNIHQHTEKCYDEQRNLVCGYADFVIHEHNSECYDADGKLWCPLPEIKPHTHSESCFSVPETAEIIVHTHTDDCYTTERGELICTEEESDGHVHSEEAGCYDENGELICQIEESSGHKHTDECYAWENVLICDLPTEAAAPADPAEPKLICNKEEIIPHKHSSDCYDKNGLLICGKIEILEHVHSSDCFEPVEKTADVGTIICKIPEHTHTEECYASEERENTALSKADKSVVIEAVVYLTGEDVDTQSQSKPRMAPATVNAASEDNVGDIKNHLTDAHIEIDGKSYDGVSPLNPGEQFVVSLQWQLNRSDLTNTGTYEYTLPSQINVKDVEETVLYDGNNNRKGVYSIKEGVLTVTYDNIADFTMTTFKLNATWNQDKIKENTTIEWNDTLNTPVKFDKSQIAVTKNLMNSKTIEDGSLVREYAVNVTTDSKASNITLTDKLTSEKFHFYQGYYEVNGIHYDYRYSIISADGIAEYKYGNFPAETFDENGKQKTDTITFDTFDLEAGKTCTVEYAVKLDANDRFELDKDGGATGMTNSATVTYLSGDDTISSSVKVTDTYRAESKWILKEQGNLNEGDIDKDTDIPWKVTVNPVRDYDIGGAVIGDSIQTENVVYKTDQLMTITSITDSVSTVSTPQWITLSDEAISAIRSVAGNASELLFKPEGEAVLSEINKAVGHEIKKEELSNYVFVGESKNQFVWFTPETGTPTTYELSYIVDTSEAKSNVLANSAGVGWKQWTSGVVVGSFIQEIDFEKKNDGVHQEGNDYFVDWTITLNVPAGRNAIPNVFLYDALPYHDESGGYDQLVGLKGNEFDYNRLGGSLDEQMKYLNEISHSAFEISTNSEDSEVLGVVKNAITSLGHPVNGLTGWDYELYEAGDIRGQLQAINGGENYEGKLVTPTRFGVYLGNLPDTLGKEGYTITVKYRTKVDEKLIEDLNGRAYGYNYVAMMQRKGTTDIMLGGADANYWVDHSTAENTLAKSVVAFDSEKNIITYKVNINPDANLKAIGGTDYILRDVLDLTGASFVKDSFTLSFQGEVSETGAFTWDDSKETVLWRSDDGEVDLSENLSYGMKHLVLLNVENLENGSSQFGFTLINSDNLLALSAPEEYKGQLAPMVLTYKVQLPIGTEIPTQETIANSVTLHGKSDGGSEVLLDGVKTEFDYTSAMHKRLNVMPNGDNGYTATFEINVDKSKKEWKNTGDSFTISDTMSKSLVADITSIKVLGIGADGEKELSKEDYTPAYDDRTSENQNYLSVTIKDSKDYTKYRIVYDAKVQGEINSTVAYANVAEVKGTEIESEEVIKDVYIQQQDGSAIQVDYKLKLLKYDASNANNVLVATFDLYAYDKTYNDGKGGWKPRKQGLTTDNNGELVLQNDTQNGDMLTANTWYKLVETNAPKGYIKDKIVYFYIPPVSPTEKPEKNPNEDEIKNFNNISLDGSSVLQIPNYKASLRLHKMDEDKGADSYLSGAEFALYSDSNCNEREKTIYEDSISGIYSLELSDLEQGKTYYLKEIKAPEGYLISDTVYTMTFNNEGNVTLKDGEKNVLTDIGQAYLIANKRSYELPETGGTGTLMYIFGGIAMIAGALIYVIKRRSRIIK